MPMGVSNVLDTAALLNWPIELLDGGYVVENQRLEVSRVSPDRMLSLEAANLIWKSPSRAVSYTHLTLPTILLV